jgi:hypothetical protein
MHPPWPNSCPPSPTATATVIVAQSNTTLVSDQGKALIEHLRADAPAVSQGLDILAPTYLLLLLMFRSSCCHSKPYS